MDTYGYNNLPKFTHYNFECEKCSFTCSYKKDYDRHLTTAKHKRIHMDTSFYLKKPTEYMCSICSKTYKYHSGLAKHKRKCNIQTFEETKYEPNIPEKQEEIQITETSGDYKNMFIELIKQNQDFKTLIVEQTKQLNEQQKENQTLHKQLIDVVKEGKNINSNNTINNNQNFNLNFFLNNTCKDAMNMSEFIENMDVNFKDIEYIGRNGYVNGMTNMILSRIKDLDVTKRPLHCTDLKRETMYIKDNDEWNKDTPDNTQLRNMVKIVAKHNQYQFPLWREKHPSSDDMNSATFEFSLKMIQNILGDVGEEQIKLDNKVMRNLSKHILVDKNI